MNIPKTLTVNATITSSGIEIQLNENKFPIVYPKKIWAKFPVNLKKILRDNLAYSSTLFVPQMLNLRDIEYKTNRPLSETFLYKNGIYDMPISAIADGKKSIDYIRRFFNTRPTFQSDHILAPEFIDNREEKSKKIIIPFSFGKESLLTYSVAKDIGLDPVLVYVIEPSHTYEHFHKRKLIKLFEREFNIKIQTVFYNPGIFRYGKLWNLKTDLGWGLHTTDYSILLLPFLYYFGANLIAFGNEPSCNDYFYTQNLLTYKAAYDQHSDWISQQSLLSTMLLGKKVQATSFVEPVYEIAETKILQGRYPDIGKYQMSCEVKTLAGKINRWCQNCTKCSYMYVLLTAFGTDPKKVGFTQNLLDKNHKDLYEYFFNYDADNPEYGSQEELGLAFYLTYLRNEKDYSVIKFEKKLLKKFMKSKKKLFQDFLSPQNSKTIPAYLKKKVLQIYSKELQEFKT